MPGALSARISSDGKFVYVGGQGGGLFQFERARPADGGNGLLTFKSCFNENGTTAA